MLCHSSDDKPAVRDLYERLHSNGFDPWLDEKNLLPGQNWSAEITQAVRASDVVIVCLSPASLTKEGYVQKEIMHALDVADEKPPGTIFLIPARLEPCEVPERFSGWQWVDLFDPRGYERLVASLRARQSQLRGRPDLSRSSRRTVQPLMPEPPVSLAEKMRRTLQERETAEDVARAQQQSESELRQAARRAAPAQFDTLAALLREKGDSLNDEQLPGFPPFKYIPVNHRLDAGKFAIELNPYAALDSYSVEMLVGLHPNAGQFLAAVPDIPTHKQRLNASMDQHGFYWCDSKGQKCDVNRLLDGAMEVLCSLILEDIRQR
jgi:hypothetical protein